jgi:ABC-type branched-subunit amino acid transport system substrate-binding protein
VLIYYNNARARQGGSPFTLAVVVPIDKNKDSGSDREMLQGVAQAQHQFNMNGGLKGRFLEIAIASDGNKPDKAQQVAQELVKKPFVLGVIGHDTSEASLAALAEYEQAGLAMISPTSTSTGLKRQVFFRTVPSDASAGKKLADYTKNSLGLNNVMIFYNPANLYSNSLREAFMQNFQRLGGKEVGKSIDLTNPKLDADKEVASRLHDQVQAALLFPNLEDRDKVLPIAKAIAKVNANLPQGQRLKLLGGDALYTLKRKTGDVEGLVLAVPWFAESKQSKDFSKAAELIWGKGDLISWRTATSFDATQAFIKALSPHPTRSTILQGLRHVNLDPSKTSGEALKFTSDGESGSEPILIKVVGGKFTDVK